jgi:hypothetical protein
LSQPESASKLLIEYSNSCCSCQLNPVGLKLSGNPKTQYRAEKWNTGSLSVEFKLADYALTYQ